MCERNQTMAPRLVLLGFGNLHGLKYTVSALFLIVYIVTVTGNILLVGLITTSPRLHSPMYIFLCNLSLCEIVFTTNIVPNMLSAAWREEGTMSIYGCFTQFYVYSSSGAVESITLTVMAFDRYLAICNPLRYSSVMDPRLRNQLLVWTWLLGFLAMSVITITIGNLPSCRSNTIDHLFCDLAPILQMVSANTLLVEVEAIVIAITFGIFPFVLVVTSYACIFNTVLRIPSDAGSHKAFSTCSSHLASVCTYFGTLFIIYLAPPHGRSMKLNKILSLLYVIVTPLFNPIIYCLRNQDIKACISSYITINKRNV